ncbi:uncharacterized protein [Onthophagus taurus]|uniref:uncharacterized protein n=1 Tax=Onthophagus taurus TaxID=166361 RepID=UPI000C20CD13|nr:uncharacterized protein LOC111424702 [Onthophagus taurus]
MSNLSIRASCTNRIITSISQRFQHNNPSAVEVKKKEEELTNILAKKFPNAKKIDVNDVSGGCGSMFDVVIASDDFKDMNLVKQHQMVTNALKEEIKLLHGIRIQTKLEHDTIDAMKKNNEVLISILRKNFPKAKKIDVNDISGGNGSVYDVTIASDDFKNTSFSEQNQLVSDSVEEAINWLRGIKLQTKFQLSHSCEIEAKMKKMVLISTLTKKFPNAEKIDVNDASGGFGSIFDVVIVCNEFEDVPLMTLNQMVTDALKDEFKLFHGTRIQTKFLQCTPEEDLKKKLISILIKKFPNAYKLDVSYRNSTFDVVIVSDEFKNISLAKQHQMVINALKEEMKLLRGYKIQTKLVPTM